MDLQSFVKETICQIVRGVKDAQEEVGDLAIVNYRSVRSETADGDYRFIHFDAAVTANESQGTSGSGGLRVAFLGAEGKAEKETSSSSVSRIKFTVPVKLPDGPGETRQSKGLTM